MNMDREFVSIDFIRTLLKINSSIEGKFQTMNMCGTYNLLFLTNTIENN